MTLRTLHKKLREQRREGAPREPPPVRPEAPVQVPLLPDEEPKAKTVASPVGPRLLTPRPPPPERRAPLPMLLPGGPLPEELARALDAIAGSHPRFHASLLGLDPAQLSAVLSPLASVLVRAPVGSGKTRVLVHRVVYLHLVRGIPLSEMAVLTFTNRAADEIRERILSLADGPDAITEADLWLTGTFHSVARMLLARLLPIESLGYRSGFTVLEDERCDELLDRLITKHRLKITQRKKARSRIRALSSEGPAPADDLLRLAALFAEEKRATNAMDFDDLIANATQLLEALRADAAPPSALRLCAVVIDEMQDCEPRDLRLLHALRGPAPCALFFGVGDPNQAIYGFRGSAPGVFVRAEGEFDCTVHGLPVNYRSSRTIVDAARSVLSLEQCRLGGDVTSVREPGARVVLTKHHDPVSEALYLVPRLTRLHEEGAAYRDMAILFRIRAQGEVLKETLSARGVPCALFDDPEVEDAVRLLTLHSAKGLEFRHVFLSGINDGLLPLGRRRADIDDAEERRLLFVGLTRARDLVEISYHAKPHEAGALGEPSPYLRWLPATLVDRQEGGAAPAPAVEAGQEASSQGEGAPPSLFAVGALVKHARYGTGTVLRVEAATIVCDFGKRGERAFPVALCPLTPA